MPTTQSLLTALLSGAISLAVAAPARADRIRDLADVAGARENQLTGYGIVTGLAGTGDDMTVPFTGQSVLSLLRRLGVQVPPAQLRLRNVAAVVVTANIPAFARQGSRIDVTVSSIGNARSLSGGVLVQTLLRGADQRPYAVAQGALLVGGYDVRGITGTTVRTGMPTTARIAEGAIVEREIASTLMTNEGLLTLELRRPGFAVATRIANAVNQQIGAGVASAPDGGAVVIRVPDDRRERIVELIAAIEDLDVEPVRRARVVVNERTGTIVATGDVRLAPVALVHGSISINIRETPAVSQPPAPGVLSQSAGSTVVVPQSDISVNERPSTMRFVPATTTLSEFATAFAQLGLLPRELAGALEALRTAGALEAELVIQ